MMKRKFLENLKKESLVDKIGIRAAALYLLSGLIFDMLFVIACFANLANNKLFLFLFSVNCLVLMLSVAVVWFSLAVDEIVNRFGGDKN